MTASAVLQIVRQSWLRHQDWDVQDHLTHLETVGVDVDAKLVGLRGKTPRWCVADWLEEMAL